MARASIGNNDHPVTLTMQGRDSLAERFSLLAQETPDRRRVDLELRMLDVTLSAFFLLVSLPLTVPIGIANLLSSGRPVFYRGQRVGRGGRVFTMTKFRTLRPGAEGRIGHHLGAELVQQTESEVTKLGRWLRATQLDEIPQFWNVFRGDMSLVGPRPIRPRFFEELAEELPAYWQRLVVRPGLTGFAQVRRGYETSMAEKLAHDLEWIADRSVRLYLRTPRRHGLARRSDSFYTSNRDSSRSRSRVTRLHDVLADPALVAERDYRAAFRLEQLVPQPLVVLRARLDPTVVGAVEPRAEASASEVV